MRKGFSLIELVAVVLMIGTLAVIVVSNLFSRRSRVEFDNTTRQIAALLREAQSRSASRDESVGWGAHFDNNTSTKPFYALFKSSYSAENTVSRFNLPNLIRFATSSVAEGGTLDIAFAELSGAPSTSTPIIIEQTAGVSGEVIVSSTITAGAAGLISF